MTMKNIQPTVEKVQEDEPLTSVKAAFAPILKKFGKLVRSHDVFYSGKKDVFILQICLTTGQERNHQYHIRRGFL